MKTNSEKTILPQLVATFGVSLLTLENGIIDGWTPPNMARLTGPNSTIPLTLSEASWLASYLKLGRFVSVILLPMFIDLAGSKRAILYIFVPVGVSWILTMLAKSSTLLYIARFLTGIVAGLSFGCFPMYLGEISTPKLRGTFTATAALGVPLGVLAGTAAETHLPESVSCSIYLVPCVLGIILFAWLPDSPYHLMKMKKTDEAYRALDWYRGHGETDKEMEEIVEFVESSGRVAVSEKLRMLRLAPIRKAALLVTLVYVCPQLCGVFNIFYYIEIILTNAKISLIEPSDVVVYMNVVLVVSAVLSVNLIDKLGRRIFLMGSMSLMIAGYVGLGLHYHLLNSVKVDPANIQILPIVSVTLIMVPYLIAVSPLMNALLGEMFPSSIKSTAAMIVIFISSFAGFIATLSYQPLVSAIGETYVFWMYASLMASCLPVFFFYLPETKGKSLQEIQNVLNKGQTLRHLKSNSFSM